MTARSYAAANPQYSRGFVARGAICPAGGLGDGRTNRGAAVSAAGTPTGRAGQRPAPQLAPCRTFRAAQYSADEYCGLAPIGPESGVIGVVPADVAGAPELTQPQRPQAGPSVAVGSDGLSRRCGAFLFSVHSGDAGREDGLAKATRVDHDADPSTRSSVRSQPRAKLPSDLMPEHPPGACSSP
jgi:hypothetical protein